MEPICDLGNVYIVAAPSGTGKSTLIDRLIKILPGIEFSVSYTTRAPRPGEVDGKHYHFTDRSTFEAMIAEGAFLEYARFVDNYYGTSKQKVDELLNRGLDVLLEIEVDGARQVKAKMPQACAIFIYPPNYKTLEERLIGRGSDSAEIVNKRLMRAAREVRSAEIFDFALVNDNLDLCFEELLHVFQADRLRALRRGARLRAILDTFPEIG